ncbi:MULTISPECIES: AraC family transcriptional regulator [Pseudomonas]|uniref:Helix-turn-helix transcriptional regulator n=1 Tax=Pseudomonas sessilinigenes TaxID=658629 RepID=A0ABX8MQR4_9PSED|nr:MULTISPECIES: helix-turn-helix transcriptional regulator [Pseudomonas]AZC22480.1 Transcriptional regulator, AraC family [Pseudomonas sessilinigenes]QXH41542.1 helix-turn-helix transcriptional regulator [Pseudomonas sessilinigenes]UMZ12859.1 helix-turn-helix transcriptional regulator [Pseudomonas sp. MPFS]
MHPTDIDPYENTPRDAVVTATHYQDGQHFGEHRHRRGQFAYAASGVISVFTEQGNWVVPPQRAIWVPADVPHAMQMSGPVLMLNTYVRVRAANRLGLPGQCQVLEVSELLRQLLIRAVDIPPRYAPQGIQGQLMNLLLHEIGAMVALPLNAPLPAEPRLMKACRALLEQPSLEWTIDEMARRAGMSRRTFTRLFRQQTGVSFVQWRQQACLLAAVVRLGNGQPVTRVATDLGYSSPSAFSGVFRKVLGQAPSRYFAQARD